MSCLWSSTGRTRPGPCTCCGASVTFSEMRDSADGRTDWLAEPHRAPCGAHCTGGGVEAGETEVHIPAFGNCPRCGATESKVVGAYVDPSGRERVVIREDLAGGGHRIEHEVLAGGEWEVRSRYRGDDNGSLDKTLLQAKQYFRWLESPPG